MVFENLGILMRKEDNGRQKNVHRKDAPRTKDAEDIARKSTEVKNKKEIRRKIHDHREFIAADSIPPDPQS